MFDTGAIRRRFPHTKKAVYFNCASNGPLANPAYLRQDSHFKAARMAAVGDQAEVFSALANIRRNGARILGAGSSEVGFGFNTTFGLNLAAFGLPLKRGDEVLLPDNEFPANVYPWLELRNRGVRVRFVKSVNGFFSVENFQKAITERTRVLAVSYVQYFNGYKIDVETISEICRRHNIHLVLDCIQAAGCEPMRLRKWNVAVASAGGQKWLLSSQGTGLFYVSEEMQKHLVPPWRSWLSVDWKCQWHDLRKFTLPYAATAGQYEMGTYPGPLVMSFDWALDFITGIGIRAIQRHNHSLLDLLIHYLQSRSIFRITSSLERKHRSSILSFTTDRADIKEIHRRLLRRRIVTSLREGAIRVAVHIYNNRADIDRLIKALDEITPRVTGGDG